jgi:hypothetical protein
MKSGGAGWLWLWCAALRERRAPASAEEVAGFEAGVLAGFVPGLDRILDGAGP